MKMSENANYGNWVPAAMMKMLWAATGVLCLVTVLLFLLVNSPVPGVIGLIVTAAALCMTFYMQRCRQLFDFQGGGVMGEIHQFLVDHFPWEESRKAQGVTDGSGLILDIGCGSIPINLERMEECVLSQWVWKRIPARPETVGCEGGKRDSGEVFNI